MIDVYPCGELTGTTDAAVDGIDGADLADGDAIIACLHDDATYGDAVVPYVLDADSAVGESVPDVIAPNANGGDKRWELTGFLGAFGWFRGVVLGGCPSGNLSSAGAISTGQCMGHVLYVSGAGTYTLPPVSGVIDGGLLTVVVIGSIIISLDPDASDRIRLNGSALDDGDKITSDGSPGAVITLHKDGPDGWTVVGGSLGWIDGGA